LATSDETHDPSSAGDRRCGFVTVLGPTNAGKSTLVNALVGTKVAIVSHKVQTTRAPIRGIAVEGKSQIVFLDTAGIFSPKRRLDRAMVDAAWSVLEDADAVLLVIDAASGADEDVMHIVGRLKSARMPRIAILNKIDRVEDKPKLLALAKRLDQELAFDRIFMVSALEGKGVGDLRKYLAGLMPVGPWHYAEDDVTDVPMRTQAAEMTRECIYRFLHQELPYTTTVETMSWKTLKDGSARVEQTIYVEREGQKKIVLGKGGATIKSISSAARRSIEEMAGHRVHLFLFVKVRENWESDPERYREMGLPFPKS
jgi:GTP-binding protein Era